MDKFYKIFSYTSSLMFLSNLCTEICPHQAKYLKVGRREAAAARLELNKRKKKKEKLDIEEVPF